MQPCGGKVYGVCRSRNAVLCVEGIRIINCLLYGWTECMEHLLCCYFPLASGEFATMSSDMVVQSRSVEIEEIGLADADVKFLKSLDYDGITGEMC